MTVTQDALRDFDYHWGGPRGLIVADYDAASWSRPQAAPPMCPTRASRSSRTVPGSSWKRETGYEEKP
jgi:hypothetical protein